MANLHGADRAKQGEKGKQTASRESVRKSVCEGTISSEWRLIPHITEKRSPWLKTGVRELTMDAPSAPPAPVLFDAGPSNQEPALSIGSSVCIRDWSKLKLTLLLYKIWWIFSIACWTMSIRPHIPVLYTQDLPVNPPNPSRHQNNTST